VLPRRRQAAGWIVTLVGVPALTVVFAEVRSHTGLPTVLLVFLALVVTTAGVGGTVPAVAAALGSFLAANWYFTPPYHRLAIGRADHVVALCVFLGVALVVSRFVDTAARRGLEAARARSEAETLAGLAAVVIDGDPLPGLLEHLRSVFGLQAAALLTRAPDGWRTEAAAGEDAPTEPDAGDLVRAVGGDAVLVGRGGRLTADDHRVLGAFAARLGASLEHLRLRREADQARALARADELRTALLQAVSHDLRSPLASIKASATSLRQDDVEWTPGEVAEFVATINDETDHLARLVDNLLDMSRIQAGAVEPMLRAVPLDEIVPAALVGLGPAAHDVEYDGAERLPPVRADPALLERVVANIVQNALNHRPAGTGVRIEADLGPADGSTAGAQAATMQLRVSDRGRGIAPADRDRVFQPFQRLGDSPVAQGAGVGLGLAVARGFVSAMGGSISIEDTPGGGTTVLVVLPLAR
jgi:two-component system sensor histidine kinase KdpD